MFRTSTFIGLVTALVLVLAQVEPAKARGGPGGDGKHVGGASSRGSDNCNRKSRRSSSFNRDGNGAQRTNTGYGGDAHTSLNRRLGRSSTDHRPSQGQGLGSGNMTNGGLRWPIARQLSSDSAGTNLGRGLDSGNMSHGGQGARWLGGGDPPSAGLLPSRGGLSADRVREGASRPGGGARPYQLPGGDRGYRANRNFNHYQPQYDGDTIVYVTLPPFGEQTPGTTVASPAAPPTK
jgi:hypothetical protein